MKKIIFIFLLYIENLSNKYRVDFYRYKYVANAIIKKGVLFANGTAIVIFSSGRNTKLNIGTGCDFRRNCLLTLDGDGSLEIQDNNFFNNGCSISCINQIKIGMNNLFGENVKIYDHNHKFSQINKSIREQGFTAGSIVIGNNCWIGSNCTILNNVVIGDNVVIGANNLIYKSIPANNVVKTVAEFIVKSRL